MLALARKVIAGEGDADSVESVFAQAQQVAADAEALLVDDEVAWARSRSPSNWSRLESQSKRGGRSSPGPCSWRRSRLSPEGVHGSRPDRSLREGLGLIEADPLSMEHLEGFMDKMTDYYNVGLFRFKNNYRQLCSEEDWAESSEPGSRE